MKLSDMNGEMLRQALCDLALPLCTILQDERTHILMDQFMDRSIPLATLAVSFLERGVPLLLQDHAEDTFAVLSILTGHEPQVLRSMNAVALIRLARACCDSELAAFFGCAGTAAPEQS